MFVEDNNHMLNNIEIKQDIISSKMSKLKINTAPGVDAWISSQDFSGKCYSMPLLYI